MKKLLFSAISTAIALMAFNTTAATLPTKGLVTFSWKIAQQEPDTTHSVTNKTTTGTNIVTTTTDKPKSVTFNNAYLITLLENSFNTTFPSGTKLVFSTSGSVGNGIYLVDKTGTNVVLDISPVVTVLTSNLVRTGTSSSTQNTTATKTTTSGNGGGSEAGLLTFAYDDSALTTADGTHTTFSVSGSATIRLSTKYTITVTAPASVSSTGTESASFSFSGAGAGTIEGTDSFISGTVSGSSSGPFEEL